MSDTSLIHYFPMTSPTTVTFCFDIVCPYAYLASRRIEDIIKECAQVQLIWQPVLLGGLYKLDAAPQGAAGSATSVMPAAKQLLVRNDLLRQFERFHIPYSFPSQHPMKSIHAQRILCAVPEKDRARAAHAFYKAYWVDNLDITSKDILSSLLQSVGLSTSLLAAMAEVDPLTRATQWAHEQCA